MKKETTKNIWSILCKKAIVDEQTKLVSLIDIIEKIVLEINFSGKDMILRESFDEKPIQIPGEITIASFWSIAEEDRGKECVLETVLKDHNSNRLGNNKISFKTGKEQNHHRTLVRLNSFLVTGSGPYTITSLLKNQKGKVLAKKDLQVNVILQN